VGENRSPAPSLTGGIPRDQAIALARSHLAPDWTFIDAEAGTFARLDSEPQQTGPGSDVKPTDLVWAVTFTGSMTICPPNGAPCFSPRPGIVVVYLDFRSGALRMTEGSSPQQ
jgi:hypothetical protein